MILSLIDDLNAYQEVSQLDMLISGDRNEKYPSHITTIPVRCEVYDRDAFHNKIDKEVKRPTNLKNQAGWLLVVFLT